VVFDEVGSFMYNGLFIGRGWTISCKDQKRKDRKRFTKKKIWTKVTNPNPDPDPDSNPDPSPNPYPNPKPRYPKSTKDVWELTRIDLSVGNLTGEYIVFLRSCSLILS
jgi:hypothetical protein